MRDLPFFVPKNGFAGIACAPLPARLSEMEEYKGLSEQDLQDIAYDETIAEMSETILTDTDAAQRLSRQIYKQDKGLWEKIEDFFTGLVEKLRNAYRDSDPDSEIGRLLKRAVQDNTEIAQAWADAVSDAGENYQLQDGQKNNAREGVRYSLRGTTDGRTVAVVDEDILSNIDLTQWNKQTKKKVQAAAKEALKKFSDGIVVDGIVVDGITRNVNKVSRNEYTGSKYSEKISKTMPQLYADKMRAASAIDDVVIAATDWARDGKLLHPRTDNFVDFDHGNVLIEAGRNQYVAEVVVGITDRGNAVFYDVVDIQPTQFTTIKEEPSPNVTTNKSPDIAYESSSDSTVPQQDAEVKGNVRYSARNQRDSEYMELAKEPEKNQFALEEMVQTAANENGFHYRRQTNRKYSPQRDGHIIMFVDGVDSNVSNYGDYVYYATGKGAIQVEDILPEIRDLAEEFYGDTVSDEEINPPDIVMSAGIWDDQEFVQYAWDQYFEAISDNTGVSPALATEDGLLMFDRDDKRIKSGAAIEYDDSGNVIPLSQRFNADNEDIRFSDRNSQSRQVERLERKNAELKAQAEYLRQVVKIQKSGNKAHILDRSSVNAIGKELMESVNAKGSEFGKKLNGFYRALGTEDMSYEAMQDRAGELADWLLEHH